MSDLESAANQFVGKHNNRKQLSRTLTANDLPQKLSLVLHATQTSEQIKMVCGVHVIGKRSYHIQCNTDNNAVNLNNKPV